MTVLYILIPVAIVLVVIAILVFNWAVNSGQYDDLDGPAHSILFDDEEPIPSAAERDTTPTPPDEQARKPSDDQA
ncbi:MAG: cbb3-type cytochrome oxidase assembly protein CcoS [Pseudomonas sp.]